MKVVLVIALAASLAGLSWLFGFVAGVNTPRERPPGELEALRLGTEELLRRQDREAGR